MFNWLLVLAAFALPLVAQTEKAAPQQPLPFSHKVHAGALKLKCKMCHPNPDPGESMRIAPASLCMTCHSAIKTDSPAIQRLASYAKSDRPFSRASNPSVNFRR
ncbi:MAG TPA: cytochrome c3 family protein [Bryobacteraceae bacterium]|nr:cytochrome c3 family protein [Bryobacteraceae bacterium]